MLKKLFLYDMRASSRLLLPLSCVAPALGLFAVLLNLLSNVARDILLVYVTLNMLYVLCFLGIAVIALICSFFIVHRYYKNFFTDEGYLTLVLPASMEEQVGAKILSGSLWSLISSAFVSLGVFLAAGLPSFLSNLRDPGIFNILLEILQSMFEGFNGAHVFLSLLSAVLTLVAQIIIFYTAVTLGSLLMRKNKIIGSILFYLVVNFVVNILNTVFSYLLGLIFVISADQVATASLISSALSIVLNLVICLLGYFVITNMMNKKMNLE